MFEGLSAGVTDTLPRDVVHHQSRNGRPVVASRDAAEVFLTRRVPNLHLHGLLVRLHCSGSKLACDCHLVVLSGLLFREVEHNARFPDSSRVNTPNRTRIADYDELEQIIEGMRLHLPAGVFTFLN